MFSSTWTIDDIAPLGPVETAKAAGRWVASQLARASAAIMPETARITRRAQQVSTTAVNTVLRTQANRVSRLNAAQLARPQIAMAPTAARESLSAVMAARMADSHWSRCSGTIAEAIGRADVVERHQSAALQKLDLAQYGLSSLKIELSAVMSIPGFETKASLHQLPTRRSRDGQVRDVRVRDALGHGPLVHSGAIASSGSAAA